MSISLSSRGQYANTLHALKQLRDMDISSIIKKYAVIGVDKLKARTPIDSGITSESWYYNVEEIAPNSWVIEFCNSNVEGNFHVAWFIEYGHATRNGGWVYGVNYLTESLNETFDELLYEIDSNMRRY